MNKPVSEAEVEAAEKLLREFPDSIEYITFWHYRMARTRAVLEAFLAGRES